MEIGNLKIRNSKLEIRPGEAERPISSFEFPVSNFLSRVSNFEFRFSVFGYRVPLRSTGVLAAIAAFASSSLAYAQGCALCYNTASAVKAAGIQALRQGILILLIPPLAICVGVMYVGYRSRDHYHDPSQRDGEEPPKVDSLESEDSSQESVATRN